MVLDENIFDEKKIHPYFDEIAPGVVKRKGPQMCTFGILWLSYRSKLASLVVCYLKIVYDAIFLSFFLLMEISSSTSKP